MIKAISLEEGFKLAEELRERMENARAAETERENCSEVPPPTNAQWFRLFDLIGEGFQSEYKPVRMEEIGKRIKDLAREMFPGEDPNPVKSKSVLKRLAAQKPGSRAYPGYLEEEPKGKD